MEIYISNAGLALLNPYLPLLFDKCNFLEGQGGLKPESAGRAALLLQHIVAPGLSFQESDLPLNKLLCGLEPEEALPSEFEASELEKEMSEQMVKAIIAQWTIIGASSIEGFRVSWLQREGKLVNMGNKWDLTVEGRPYDILLDQIPFSISPVNHKWMSSPIQVKWR